MQDNFPMIMMQFVQDEALNHKLFVQKEPRTLTESVQEEELEMLKASVQDETFTVSESHSCRTASQ